MRTIFLLLLLSGPALGAQRTWTIARDVYTADGELVTVRGNLAYLKIDGKVEEIPIDRLSALDQQYISSLTLAPILPGPAADDEIVQEEMPLPGEPDAPAEALQLNGPDVETAYGRQPQPMPRAGYRVDRDGWLIPPQPGVAANYLAPIPEPRATGPNDRRYRRPPQQGPNTPSANSQRDNDDEGVLGFRARRIDRQRAAAARSR